MSAESALMRQAFKEEIDQWPETLFIMVREFSIFENRRLQKQKADDREQELARRRAGYERLKKYSGTMRLEKSWKEELCEALDEKYNSAD
jgi:hypothetical protein